MKWDIQQVKHELSGPAALLMAPFNDDLSLQPEALRSHVRYMLDSGMRTGRGFLICPSGTGEYTTLTVKEHQMMVETALETAGGKIPVVAGVASTDIRLVLEMARNAQAAGAKYAMIAPPFYDTVDQDGLFDWYRRISDSLELGLMIYSQSWKGLGLNLTLIERLTGLENLVSLKFGNQAYFASMIAALDRYSNRFAFIDNSLGYTSVVAHIHGASGFISGPSLWWPEFELHFFDLMQQGRYKEADHWHARMGAYMAWFGDEGWARGGSRIIQGAEIIKACLEYVGLYGGSVRPPVQSLTANEKAELWALLRDMNVKRLTTHSVGG